MAEDHKRRCEWKEQERKAGTRIKERCTPTRLEEAAREQFSSSLLLPSKRPHVCFRKVFLPPMQQSGKKKKQNIRLNLPPEAEMFSNQRSFADSKLGE